MPDERTYDARENKTLKTSRAHCFCNALAYRNALWDVQEKGLAHVDFSLCRRPPPPTQSRFPSFRVQMLHVLKFCLAL